MSRTEILSQDDKPSLFLGMRWTFAGADTRMQTGFTQQALNAFFGFQRPDTGVPGVFFFYEPELKEPGSISELKTIELVGAP